MSHRCVHCRDNGAARCDAEHCDLVRKEEAYSPDQCYVCYQYFHDVRANLAAGGDGRIAVAPPTVEPPVLPAKTIPKPLLLGDAIEKAAIRTGAKERILKWLGDCFGCGKRRDMLNRLHQWAIDGENRPVEVVLSALAELLGD